MAGFSMKTIEDDPVVVTGMALRFPGDATDPMTFWRMLCEARSAHGPIPRTRFNADAFYHPVPGHTGSINATTGHFIEQDLGKFDRHFFSLSPQETVSMDPQQRILLEVVYEALENAGLSLEGVNGSRTACYVGSFTHDFEAILMRDSDTVEPYQAIGAGLSMMANRISWFFNLRGPSISLDTACSSSLTGFHLGCQNLYNGEADMAIAAGSNLFLGPDQMIPLCAMNFLSPDGKCFSFDHRANGYARGEGFAAVILKRLSAAIRDGDTIRAVVRSSALNHDGRTPGITLPSGDAQRDLILEAHARAGLDIALTGYFEAHGTGTLAGDPIEAGGIAAAFGDNRRNAGEPPLLVGSVKTNIGHLEGTAGLAGLIKAILVLETGLIPANLWQEKVNPKIPAEKWHIQFPKSLTKWPSRGTRRVSVNSFGYGGSNTHVIVDDAYHYLKEKNLEGIHESVAEPVLPESEEAAVDGPEVHGQARETKGNTRRPVNASKNSPSPERLVVWTAAEQRGLQRIASSLAQYLAEKNSPTEDPELLDRLAFTLSSKRTPFPWRTYVLANSPGELQEELSGTAPKGIRCGSQQARVGFLFTGQGAQWSQMGKELLDVYPIFRSSLVAASDFLQQQLNCDWSLLDELLKPEGQSSINEPRIAQPMTTVLQVALVQLLRSWGLKPTRVVGHSSGEIAAAYCSGAISQEAAWRLSYYRGVVSTAQSNDEPVSEGMIAVGLSEVELHPHLRAVESKLGSEILDVACLNSPASTTVSGSAKAIDALQAILESAAVPASRLRVRNAYHSRFMPQPAMEYLARIGRAIEGNGSVGNTENEVAMFSSVTGEPVDKAALQKPEYWAENMTSRVRFFEALQSAVSLSATTKKRSIKFKPEGCPLDVFVEIGPHSVLQQAMRQTLGPDPRTKAVEYLPVMLRNSSALKTALGLAGALFCRGIPVDFGEINITTADAPPRMLVDLPPYAWNHDTAYWQESRLSKNYRFREHPATDVLGKRVDNWNPLEPQWRQWLRVAEMPWLQDHKVRNAVLFPAAGFISMAVEASRQLADSGRALSAYHLRNVVFHQVLQVPDTKMGIEVMLYMRPRGDNMFGSSATWSEFHISSYHESLGWREHCRGQIEVEYDDATREPSSSLDAGRESVLEAAKLRDLLARREECCTFEVTPRNFYSLLDASGLQYGPCFQQVQYVRVKPDQSNEVLGEIRSADLASIMPAGYVYSPPVIHPTTFDGILQILYPALARGGTDLRSTTIPSFFGDVRISARLQGQRPGSIMRCHGSGEWVGRRETCSSVFAMDPKSQEVLISMEEVRSKSVTTGDISATAMEGQGGSTATGGSERILDCFHVTWKPDIDFMSTEQLIGMSKPQPVEPEVMAELELLGMCYIRKALARLDQMPESVLADRPPHVQKYVAWMRRQMQLFDQGELCLYDPSWRVIWEDEEQLKKLIQRVEAASVDGRMMTRLGPLIVDVLKGELDFLQLTVEDGLLNALYDAGVGNEVLREHGSRCLELVAFKNPELEILEIGAGTGGTTAQILDALAERALSNAEGEKGEILRAGFKSYTYTDLSSGFFEKARDRFSDWANVMTYEILDIEKDPVTQGTEGKQYDVVIASNVLHATSRLENTVENVSKCLKPGGRLVIFELVRPFLRHALTFGLTPGWWLAEEKSRQWGPFTTEQEWNRLLQRAGFGSFDHIIRDYEGSHHYVSVMVSTYSPAIAVIEEPALPRTDFTIITSSEHRSGKLESLLGLKLAEAGISSTSFPLAEGALAAKEKKPVIIMAEAHYESVLEDMSKDTFRALRELVANSPMVLWVTAGGFGSTPNPKAGIIVGLSRVVRAENEGSGSRFVTYDLSCDPAAQSDIELDGVASRIVKIAKYISTSKISGPMEGEYAEIDGMIHITRLVSAPEPTKAVARVTGDDEVQQLPFGSQPALILDIKTPGMLGSLYFRPDEGHGQELPRCEIEIEVRATGLNFRDVVVALGQMSDTFLGCECAGIVVRVGAEVTDFAPGDRVFCISSGSLSTYYRGAAGTFMKIPEGLSFEQAAALPLAYCTALYSLVDVAHLVKGESVLIHAAAGGVGQAAIAIAQMLKAEIYVTVGTAEKKTLMVEHFGIPRDRVFSSRDLSFAKAIRRSTGGRGVDVVLNSLSDEALRESWRCVAPFGRFIEIGKRDIRSNSLLEMQQFAKNVSFAAVEYEGVMTDPVRRDSVAESLLDLVEKGIARPAEPLTVYTYAQIEDSLRLMQAGKHMGKLVLVPHAEDAVPVMLPPPTPEYFRDDASYLMAGGLGGLGRSMLRWMVDHGAKNIVSVSRSGDRAEAAKDMVAKMRKRGANIRVLECDITLREPLKKALTEGCEGMPPIRGCIQAAMVLRDVVFEQMTLEDFNAALHPKVKGSWNLHELLPRDLDFFVMLSSASGIAGMRGQCNYAAGNTFQDALAHHRVAKGLRARVVDLGLVLAAGYAAEQERVSLEKLQRMGFLGINEDEFLALIEYALNPDNPKPTAANCQFLTGLARPSTMRQKVFEGPYYMNEPLFSHLRAADLTQAKEGDNQFTVAIIEGLKAAQSFAEASDVAAHALVDNMCLTLGMPKADVDFTKPLHTYGVDSLVAVVVRYFLFRDLRADIAVAEIMGSSSIEALGQRIAIKSEYVDRALVTESFK